MVQWKGKLQGDVGSKAENLDKVDNFNVPNFFVITSKEFRRLFKGSETSEEILNTGLETGKKEEIENAYKDIGMTSEVRKAAGKAKSLVGGQRNGQKVSVRVSEHENGVNEFGLNIGSSNLFNSLKKVVSTYYKRNQEFPPVIIQKMVEPEYTGAVIRDYPNSTVIEVVEGLGYSLEEGNTKPHLYFFRNSKPEKVITPETQLKITRNPINGEKKRKKIRNPNKPFTDREIEEVYNKAEENNVNFKFVYKRGTFHIVDIWRPKNNQVTDLDDFEGLKVSKGSISGVVGREITYSETTLSPEKYDRVLISEKGGYTSKDAQLARQKNKTALFSYSESLSSGERINLAQGSVTETSRDRNPFQREETEEVSNSLTGSEVLPLNPSRGKGVFTAPPFGEGYRISRDRDGIPQENYLETCADVFRFEGDTAVLDLERIEEDVREKVMKYLSAEKKILVADKATQEDVLNAVENGFDVFASREDLEGLEEKVLKAEKKFMLDKLQEL